MIQLVQVMESDVDQLHQMRGDHFVSVEVETYYKIFYAYLTGDIEDLTRLIQNLKQEVDLNPKLEIILKIAQLRLSIRTNQNLYTQMKELIEVEPIDTEWKGEVYGVISSAASYLELHEIARDYSLKSAKEFKLLGAQKKSIRMLMNAISSESCYRPEKHYLSDLIYIYKEAKLVGDSISIGNTLVNLSREYQKMGLYHAALKQAHRAIAVLSKRNAGGVDYFLAMAHRAHVHCQLGAFYDAQVDMEMAKACQFLEVEGALKILCEQFPQLNIKTPQTSDSPSYATYSWQIRKKDPAAKKASKMESQLIELLIQRPFSRRELCAKLYGDKLPMDVTDNRFSNLLNRIKKRNPSLIICKDSTYFLSEHPTYPHLLTKV